MFDSPASVTVRTSVCFAREQPNAVAYGTLLPSAGRLLWHNRRRFVSEAEQPAAKIAYANALETFFQIADESDVDGRKVNRFALE